MINIHLRNDIEQAAQNAGCTIRDVKDSGMDTISIVINNGDAVDLCAEQEIMDYDVEEIDQYHVEVYL